MFMSDFFIGEIKIMAFGFAPRSWAQCNGQLLPINQNQALFSLLGTQYGGNGTQNFALPDFRGRTPLHFGNGFTQGQQGGEENHTLIVGEMPTHTHTHSVSSGNSTEALPTNNSFGNGAAKLYASQNNGAALTNIGGAGGSQPHNNMQPYSVLNFCIALQGIFPSRN
jgi:microcystin-dependent protein